MQLGTLFIKQIFDIIISLKDPELVYSMLCGMNQQQTHRG